MSTAFLRSLAVARQNLHLHHRRCTAAISIFRRPWSTFIEPTRTDDTSAVTSIAQKAPPRSFEDRSDNPTRDAFVEAFILKDVKPVMSLIDDIFHYSRYKNGQKLIAKDEKIVRERLLAHHPQSEDIIGCGIDSIMVDWRPKSFRSSRSLFVVRTDGERIDFSFRECLWAYVRAKYPSHAEKFIKVHLVHCAVCRKLNRRVC